MVNFFSKTALAWGLVASFGCSPMKRLDLIEEKSAQVTAPVEAGATTTFPNPAVETTGVESIPVPNTSGSGEPSTGNGFPNFTSETTEDDRPAPYPCPPEKPYPFNGQCVQCNVRGGSQCWPGYSCEMPRLKCEPLCSTDRDCIFREDTLPVCDRVYRSCRYCISDSECGDGLVCFGQCVPPPPPESSATFDGPNEPPVDAAQPMSIPLDAGDAAAFAADR